MLTITKSGEGKCTFCCQTSDGVQAKFQDGLSGFFCWKDFKNAVKARAEAGKEEGRAADSAASRGAAS